MPRERRATTCRGDGIERMPTEPTVDLQKQITALTDAISHMGVLLATLTKQVVDDEIIRASQQQFVCGCEQRRVSWISTKIPAAAATQTTRSCASSLLRLCAVRTFPERVYTIFD